jgi:DNA-3-methyladenine glycosylase II
LARVVRGFDVEAAAAHLAKRDRRLAAWMKRIGPLPADARWKKPFDVADALARAILYQQLSGKAAATIVGRVEKAIGTKKIHAPALERVTDEQLRACGVSGNKARALRDLAEHERRGEIPDTRRMATMSDDAIVEALTAVRGIGKWTVQMMLMFRLGRPDQLPIDDLGIRKGAQRVDKLDDLPTPKELAERGERWGPYRTYAGLYLWRIADSAATMKAPTPRSQE